MEGRGAQSVCHHIRSILSQPKESILMILMAIVILTEIIIILLLYTDMRILRLPKQQLVK